MFQLLHDKILGLNPRAISCGSDQATIWTMEECFPDVTIKEFFLHLVHNVYKQLKQIGIQDLYNSNPDFALSTKMIATFCFLPVPHLDTYIDALSDDLPLELYSLLNWLEDNYVGRPMKRGTGRCSPLFFLGMWSQYDRTVAGRDRTNNHAEAAHRKMHTELGVSHYMEIY